MTGDAVGKLLTEAWLAITAEAAGSPALAQRIPAAIYRDLEDEHLPFDDAYGRYPDWHPRCPLARPHHMLGHARFLQQCGPEVDGEAVCLLQLSCDPAIGLRFGDCGQATFWITREDLEARRFDQVLAVMEGG